MRGRTCIVIVILCTLASCGDTTPLLRPELEAEWPLSVGNNWTYSRLSLPDSVKDTVSVWVDAEFIPAEGGIGFALKYKSTREVPDHLKWLDAMTASVSPYYHGDESIVLTGDRLRFVGVLWGGSLTTFYLPFADGDSWNSAGANYTVRRPKETNAEGADSGVTVIYSVRGSDGKLHEEEFTLSKGVGLVKYRRNTDLGMRDILMELISHSLN
jgi:hypothetical protein